MDFSVLEPHLFRNAQLYAPEDLGHSDLLIAGGKIVAVKKAGHATTRPDCPESDLAGLSGVYRSACTPDWRRR